MNNQVKHECTAPEVKSFLEWDLQRKSGKFGDATRFDSVDEFLKFLHD